MMIKKTLNDVTPTVPLEELFAGFTPEIQEPLEILVDNTKYAAIIGRTKNLHDEIGLKGTLLIGMICEKNSGHFGKKLFIDAVNPHKIFISGKTGSGKSYTLGVIAEELAEQNLGIGTVIVDPMGTFWSMKYSRANIEDDLRVKWGLSTKSFENVRVFVPADLVDRYNPGTFDDTFSVGPDELTAEDWTTTFGLDYFKSPQSALIIEIIKILMEDGTRNPRYTVRDMINVLERHPILEEKYQANTIRALVTRLESALNWGIFSTAGTPITRISVPNQVSIIDVSLVPDYTRALVIGLLAKKILEKRTRIIRQEKISSMTGDGHSTADDEIPVTWLMVDEAQTLVPSKGKTAASAPLIEYAKRGRMSGCSLVLATQQPSSTSDEILSQIGVLISHNLSYSQDILELKKRMPSKLIRGIGDETFIRNLPVGGAIIADQTTSTKRAFVAMIRPRISGHGGKASSLIKDTMVVDEVTQHDEITGLITPSETSSAYENHVENSVKNLEDFYLHNILPKIEATQYDIPDDILEDYLGRFMEFRVASELHISGRNYITIKTIGDNNIESLSHLVYALVKRGYNYSSSEVMDENPVLVFTKNDSRLVMVIGRTKSSMIAVVLASERIEF